MLTAIVAVGVIVLVAIFVELRHLRTRIDRLSRTRVGVTSLGDLADYEDAVHKAWDEFTKAEAIRDGEDKFTSQQKAELAVERYRAKWKHDYLLGRLERARQAEIDVRLGRKTLDDVQREFSPRLSDLMAPQLEVQRIYEEVLREGKANSG